MEQQIREMESVGLGVPEVVVEDEREVLDWPIMRRKGIEKQIVAECFEDQERTFYERIEVREIFIVPDELTLERGYSNDEPSHAENDALNPAPLQIKSKTQRERCVAVSSRIS